MPLQFMLLEHFAVQNPNRVERDEQADLEAPLCDESDQFTPAKLVFDFLTPVAALRRINEKDDSSQQLDKNVAYEDKSNVENPRAGFFDKGDGLAEFAAGQGEQ
mmetsp:Transcript_42046/g.55414  ORF Transcript_42046/g.55414 Transcript_42046/m.55414 type:complete len:104 (-) Transcript_42046:142-453(-)